MLDRLVSWFQNLSPSKEDRRRSDEIRRALAADGKYGWQRCEAPSWVDTMELGPKPKIFKGDNLIYKGYLADSPGEHGPRWFKQLKYEE